MRGLDRALTRASFLLVVVFAVLAASALPAQAALVAPEDNSVQRGDVQLKDDVGATTPPSSGSLLQDNSCLRGATVKFQILKQANDAVVFDPAAIVSKTTVFGIPVGGTGPASVNWNTAEVPDGDYKVTEVVTSRVPNVAPFTGATGANPPNRCHSVVANASAKFTLRHWQYTFRDTGNKGKVEMNIDPKEFRVAIGNKQTEIQNGLGETMQIISFPTRAGGGEDADSTILPSDLAGCLADPNECVPETAATCSQHPGDCEPRLVMLNQASDPNGKWQVDGMFDLKTKAFVAIAHIDGQIETLSSFKPACAQLRDTLADKNLDVDELLGNKELTIELPLNGGDPKTVHTTAEDLCRYIEELQVETEVSLRNGAGLPLLPNPLLKLPELAAGVMFHLNIGSASGPAPVKRPGAYAVTESKLIPKLPKLPAELTDAIADAEVPELPIPVPLTPDLITALLPQGPVTQVKGKNLGGTHLVGVLNASTGQPAPPDYPIWIPLLTGATHADTAIDFVGYGTATDTVPMTCFTIAGTETCAVIQTLLGNGASIFGPSPVSLPKIP